MATPKISKPKLLRIRDQLEKRYGRRKPRKHDSFIEYIVFQILEAGNSERSAVDALRRIKKEFVDWNDMRVATIREIQDVLGPKFDRCRQRAEDLKSLLADLHTAYRTMDVDKAIQTQDGILTLRALPNTTLILPDQVERALVLAFDFQTFPCDEDQYELLRFLGGVPKKADPQEAAAVIADRLDREDLLRLHFGLREHVDFCRRHDADGPRPVDWRPSSTKKRSRSTKPWITLPQPEDEAVEADQDDSKPLTIKAVDIIDEDLDDSLDTDADEERALAGVLEAEEDVAQASAEAGSEPGDEPDDRGTEPASATADRPAAATEDADDGDEQAAVTAGGTEQTARRDGEPKAPSKKSKPGGTEHESKSKTKGGDAKAKAKQKTKAKPGAKKAKGAAKKTKGGAKKAKGAAKKIKGGAKKAKGVAKKTKSRRRGGR